MKYILLNIEFFIECIFFLHFEYVILLPSNRGIWCSIVFDEKLTATFIDGPCSWYVTFLSVSLLSRFSFWLWLSTLWLWDVWVWTSELILLRVFWVLCVSINNIFSSNLASFQPLIFQILFLSFFPYPSSSFSYLGIFDGVPQGF